MTTEQRARISVAHIGILKGDKNPNWGKHLSDEVRAKIRAAKLGRSLSVEHRAKIRLAGMGAKNHNWKQPMSAESRAKVGAANRGRFVSETTRAKLSLAHKGLHPSEETLTKLRGKNNHQWGKPLSEETRKKLSLAQRGDKNYRWKGGIRHRGEYEAILIHKNFYLLTHRINMAKAMGHRLRKGEEVHHINRNRRDNRIENLALCSDASAHRWCASEEAKIFFG
jgi:hypothetical protein